jgi:crotonobetainyl-CoA:carnitine CoA-transferase CaiB-like acyl-CoA transferase
MKPLEGLAILDLSHMLSGPTCTAMFAMLGAEVIKVERPGTGDGFRNYTEHAGPPGFSLPFCAANAGKKSIALDLTQPPSRDIIHRLARRADVVVENFRPGVPAKLGLDWDTLRAVNPRLIYCSITGFGHSGALSGWGALDQVVQAMSGLLWMNGEAGDGPVKVGFPVLDTFTGYMSVIAILAALRRREQTGNGEFIDVSMLDCALKMMAGPVASYFYTGELPKRTGNRGYRMVATADLYETRDGYIILGANLQAQYEKFCRAMGRPDLITDPRFADHEARAANNDALRECLTQMLCDREAQEVEKLLAAADVPVAMVRNLAQITSHPHFGDRALFAEARMPGRDAPITLLGTGFQLEGEKLEPGAVPRLGEHTDEVLASLGYDDAAIGELRRAGAAH